MAGLIERCVVPFFVTVRSGKETNVRHRMSQRSQGAKKTRANKLSYTPTTIAGYWGKLDLFPLLLTRFLLTQIKSVLRCSSRDRRTCLGYSCVAVRNRRFDTWSMPSLSYVYVPTL